MSKLNNNCYFLISTYTVHSIIELFLDTFLVAYFLNLTGNNIIPAVSFYIYTYAILAVIFPFLGSAVKHGYRLMLFRLSFILNAVVLLMIVWLKKDITGYIWILGSVLGLEKSLFYFPQNLLTSQAAKGGVLVRFHGYRFAWAGLAKIITPVIFGWLISIDSFINTAGFVLGLTLIEYVLSYFISLPETTHKPFSIKSAIALACKRNKIKLALKLDYLNGFIFSTLNTLVVLYVVYIFETNLNLGIFTSVFAILTVLSNILLGRFCNYRSFATFLPFCSLITFIGVACFVFYPNKATFIIYNFTYSSAVQLILTIANTNAFKVSQSKSIAALYRVEYFAMREMFIGLGRVSSFGLLLLITLTNHADLLRYFILFLNILVVVMGYMSTTLSTQLDKEGHHKC